MSSNRTINSLRNIAVSSIGQFVNLLISIINRIVFLKVLNVEYLGVSGIFSDLLTVLSLAELGIGNAIAYALYKPIALGDKEKISEYMNLYGKIYKIIGILVASIGLVITPFLRFLIRDVPNINESIYLIYILFLANTVVSYFFSYKATLLIADQKNYVISLVMYIVSSVQLITQVLFLTFTRNYIIYLIIQIIFTLTYNITISIIVDKQYSFDKKVTLNKHDSKVLFKNTKSLFIIKLSSMLVNNTDNIIIALVVNVGTIGFLSNYKILINTANAFLNQIFYGISASIGNLNVSADESKKLSIFETLNLANFWIVSWFSVGFWILSNDIIELWLGSNYKLSIDIIIILGLNFYVVGMQGAVWTYKNTMGLFVKGQYILLITALLNIVLSLTLGTFYGLFGILVATVIARLLTNVWYDPYVIFKYGFKENPLSYFKKYISYTLILAITFILTFFTIYVIGVKNILIKTLICCLIPNSIFFVAFNKKNEFFLLKEIAKKVFSKYHK